MVVFYRKNVRCKVKGFLGYLHRSLKIEQPVTEIHSLMGLPVWGQATAEDARGLPVVMRCKTGTSDIVCMSRVLPSHYQ